MIQGQSGPVQLKGYWASIKVRDGDTWKIRLTTNTPAATTSATPSRRPPRAANSEITLHLGWHVCRSDFVLSASAW